MHMRRLFLLIFFLLLLLPYTFQKRRHIKNPNEVALRKLMKITKNKMKDPTKNTPEQNGIATVTEAKLICKFKNTIITNVPKKHKEEIARSLMKCCSKKGIMTLEKLANCQDTILNFANVMKRDPKIANAQKAFLINEQKKKGKKSKRRNKRSWDYILLLKRMKRMGRKKKFSIQKTIANKFSKNGYKNHLIKITILSDKMWNKWKKSRNSNHNDRRKKRGIGKDLIAAVLILAAIWFSYLALVCLFSIIIPPFIFAILLTVIFGSIAWFCIKAAEAILDSSMENEYGSFEGEYKGYDDFEQYGEYEFDGYGAEYGGDTHFGEEGVYDSNFVDLENGFHHSTNYGPNGITNNIGNYGYSQVEGKRRRMGGFQGK